MAAKVEWGLRGVILPLITPFNDDLSVDYAGLAALVDYFIEEVKVRRAGALRDHRGVGHPLARGARRRDPGGGRADARRVPVIASTGSNSTREAIDLTRAGRGGRGRRHAAGGALLQQAHSGGPLQPLRRLSRRQPELPLIIYNIPGRTSRNIEPQTIIRLWRRCRRWWVSRTASNDLHQTMDDLPGHRPGHLQDLLRRGHHDLQPALPRRGRGHRRRGACGGPRSEGHVRGGVGWAAGGGARPSTTASWTWSTPCSWSRIPPRSSRPWSGLGLPAGPLRPPLERLTPAGQESPAAGDAGGRLAGLGTAGRRDPCARPRGIK